MRVLLAEDDRLIGEALSDTLKAAGYAVDWVQDGVAAESALDTQDYELGLFDLGLPKKDGLEVLLNVRRRNKDIAVIILTARDAIEDRVRGLDLGADDYVVKPFDPEELLARMRAVARRHSSGSGAAVLSNGVVNLDPATREASAGGATHRLSAREYALLYALMLRPGTILSRQELEDRLYGWNEEVESNVVEFVIHSIRKKLGAQVIKNVRGLGWMVSKPV